MKALSMAIALVSLAAVSSLHAEGTKKASGGKADAVFVNPAEIKWSDAPPDLPKGGQVAALQGDPFKKGPFTIRLKMPPGYKIPPHWHTQDESLTVVSGTLVLHLGDTMDAPAHNLAAGAFHYLPGKMHHAAEAKGETVVQVHGMGPFDIHYLNAADNPNKSAAATPK